MLAMSRDRLAALPGGAAMSRSRRPNRSPDVIRYALQVSEIAALMLYRLTQTSQ